LLTGKESVTQVGNVIAAAAVVKLVVFAAAQPALTPLAFLGATYQLYKVPAVRPVTVYVNAVVLVSNTVGVALPADKYIS